MDLRFTSATEVGVIDRAGANSPAHRAGARGLGKEMHELGRQGRPVVGRKGSVAAAVLAMVTGEGR